MIDRAAITGVVLAGGRGSRMGGVDKGLVAFDGLPLAARAIERLAPQVGGIVVSANRHRDDYERFGWPVVADAMADGGAIAFDGPLAGLAAALATIDTPFVATVPVDAPFFPLDLVSTLASGLADRPDASAVHACTGEREHPVFLLMRTSLAPGLAAWLASGGRRVREFLEAARSIPVAFADEPAFRNLNRPDDWPGAAHRAGRGATPAS